MSTNADVKEYLDHYLSSDAETDFAVMLNGPWGAGKTHFIKAYLEERERNAELVDPHRSIGYLYASLYGVRSISEITDQFFSQAHPVLSSKAARLFGTIASRLLNGVAGTDVSNGAENRSIVKDSVLNLDGRVLIFDDLERCAMPLADVMGFINSFVEHEGLKAIVIANEGDIPADQRVEYARKKEKLIGKSLRVTSDPQNVLESFLGKLKHPKVVVIVRQEATALLRTFNASGKQNFRSLRAVLSDYDRLVSRLDPRLQESGAALVRLLHFMVASGDEFRSGELSRRELAELPATRLSRAVQRLSKKEKSPQILTAERLETTYPEVRWDDPIVPPQALAELFEAGIIDVSAINAHLQQHPLVVGYAETPAWRQLWSWTDLPRSQYLEARSTLVHQLNNRELTHPGIILHAAGTVLGAASFGDHMLGEAEDVVAFFKRYADEVAAAGRLEPDRSVFGTMGGSYAGLGFGSRDSSEFREISKAVHEATNASFAKQMQDVASTFMDRLNKDGSAYSALHEYGVDEGKYRDAPFLHHIDPKRFAEVVIRDWAPDGQLLASLNARYEGERHDRSLVEEYPWVQALRNHLLATAASAEPPHRELLETRIKYYFDRIDQSIDAASLSASTSVAGETEEELQP